MNNRIRDNATGTAVGRFLLDHRRRILLGLLLLAALASSFIFLTTSSGIGLRDDSFSYFTAAQGLVAGRGYGRVDYAGEFKPLTNFPPAYSALLAGTRIVGLELEAGARFLAGLSFSAVILLVGLSLLWATDSPTFAIVGSGLTLFSPALLEVLSWAHSEGPYLALSLASLLALTIFIDTRSGRWLLVSVLLTALALLARYAGLSVVTTGALTLLLMGSGPWRRRLANALRYAGFSVVPLAIFLARNLQVAGSATNRPRPFWHPPSTAKVLEGSQTTLDWILPSRVAEGLGAWAILLATLLLLALVGAPWFRHTGPGHHKRCGWAGSSLPRIHSLALMTYLLLLLVSLTLFDRLTPLDNRILAPALTSGIVLFSWLLFTVARKESPIIRTGALAIAWLTLAAQVAAGLPAIRSLSQEGMGFNSPVWRSARAFEIIRELPNRPIYTNNVPAMYFLAGRRAAFLPARYDPASDRSSSEYEEELAQMRAELRSSGGYLILVGWPPRNRVEPAHFEDLTAGLTLRHETRDGLIYCYCSDS